MERFSGIRGWSGFAGAFAILYVFLHGGKDVNSLRISIVQYLNTAPLVRGFAHGPLRGKYDLSFTVPSQCAEALRRGAADLAIIPAIEYQRIPDLALVPNLSIASKKAVRSLLLISRKPVNELTRIALDRGSRSTQALTRILCQKLWRIEPEFFEAEPELPSMLQKADAALLIGDPALRLSYAIEPQARRDASGALTCSGASAGIAEYPALYVYDIVEQWRVLSKLPAVLAVWAGRRATVTPEVVQDFQHSLAFGLQHLDEICREASEELKLPAAHLRRYLTENIDYTLDNENMQGLGVFYRYAAEMGLIPEAKAIERAAEPGGPLRDSDFAVKLGK
jgi:chorismate dehydratase